MMIGFMGLLLLAQASPVSPGQPTTEVVIGEGEFVTAAAKERARPHANDKFANPQVYPEIAGRKFRVVVPALLAGSGSDYLELTALWDYDRVKHALILNAFENLAQAKVELMTQETFPHGLNGFFIKNTIAQGKSYSASNAYGVRATIARYRTNGVALVYERKAYNDESGFPGERGYGGFSYHAEIPMDGPQAQQVGPQIALVFEGQVTTFSDGSNMVCGSTDGDPSIANRADVTKQYCLASVKVDRVTFQDKTGKVLAEWKRP